MSHASDRIGRIGEDLAVRHLTDLGYGILDRNWRCARGELRGELDVVCRDGATIVVCEVKTRRRSLPEEAAESVTPAKRARLHRLGIQWRHEAGLHSAALRVDCVAVGWPPGGGSARLLHLRGIA